MTSDNTTINSTNFKVDKNGNVTANNLTSNNANITGGKINLSGGTPELSISGNDLTGHSSKNSIMADGIRVRSNTYGFDTIYLAHADSSEGLTGAITVKNSYNNSVNIDGAGISVSGYSTGKQTTIKSDEVRSPKITQTSLEEHKKNFEKLNNDTALKIILDTDIYKYNLKTQADGDKKHIGFVIGDKYKYSEEITSENNDGVDNYSMTSASYGAIQKLYSIIQDLQKEIKELKGEKNEQN